MQHGNTKTTHRLSIVETGNSWSSTSIIPLYILGIFLLIQLRNKRYYKVEIWQFLVSCSFWVSLLWREVWICSVLSHIYKLHSILLTWSPVSRLLMLMNIVDADHSDMKWVPVIFLGVKGGRLIGWWPHRHLWADCLENVGASTSHNPMGLHGLLQG
jgi:uncharacterized membrane-anchored protein